MKLENRGKAAFKAQLVTNIVMFLVYSAIVITGAVLIVMKYQGFKSIITWLAVVLVVLIAYLTILKVITVKNEHAYGGDEDNVCFVYGYPVIKTFTIPKKNVLSYKITKSGGVYKKRFSNLELTTSSQKYVFKFFENDKLLGFVNEHLKGVDHE